MKKKLRKKARVKKTQPKATPGTKVKGVVLVNYVQFDVPKKTAPDVAEALGRMILVDFHRAFCKPDDGFSGNEE